ncbi:ATP-binding cassette domain-containing protein [Pelagicoccus sp. SDUM812003]|uniref:ABC transporter ATP-binding protein n=1 Tax=Pelagicoccus sp. SDUM812003 TaxID=3041267 RepID=UPI00280C6474|nr:ATP-binding cassette domain-containing protein [Pelagicoccus sp. SDUM812003]MDQ8205170.1 ATP-binding cassette domain-containing protein [Pelagicoccus sp. SDUM812003]
MVTVDKLVKDYGALRAVDSVSFTINKGDILGFLGPNGAGKSTTMKMITGFLSPTSGTASVCGYDVAKNPIEVKKRIGYLPESSAAYPEMTVVEFLTYVAEARGFRDKEEIANRLADVIVKCHLDSVKFRTIETLSKGYRQRVGVAQAIIHDPEVLILDEPTDGLDPNQKHEVRKLIKAMAADKAIVLSTHILEEVEAICNRVIIIDQGKVLVDETPEQFKARKPGATIDEVFRELTNKNVLA